MIRLIECFCVGMIVFAFVGGCVDAGDCTCLKTKKHIAHSEKRIHLLRKKFLLPAKEVEAYLESCQTDMERGGENN